MSSYSPRASDLSPNASERSRGPSPSPCPSKQSPATPWYGHSRNPLALRRPSDSGTSRWGHASRNARHAAAAASHHRTSGWPECGAARTQAGGGREGPGPSWAGRTSGGSAAIGACCKDSPVAGAARRMQASRRRRAPCPAASRAAAPPGPDPPQTPPATSGPRSHRPRHGPAAGSAAARAGAPRWCQVAPRARVWGRLRPRGASACAAAGAHGALRKKSALFVGSCALHSALRPQGALPRAPFLLRDRLFAIPLQNNPPRVLL
jgi:hypothetical protein